MSVLAVIQRGITQAVQAAGDSIVAVLLASADPVDQQPGEDYTPSWTVYAGYGFWEKTDAQDFPATEILVTDRTLVLMKCAADVDAHDYVKVDGSVYHVYDVKSVAVGSTRVLQKLLARPEGRVGIAWDSDVLPVA